MASIIRVLAAALFLTVAGASAQTVHGQVVGFDGKPARAAVISYVAAGGGVLGEQLTDQGGGFAAEWPALPIEVRAQLEGVMLTSPVKAGQRLEFSFAKAEFYTLRGHVVDPTGQPARNIDLLCLPARPGERWSSVATTDERGRFALRVNQPVASVTADPLGWRYLSTGPYSSDTGLAIDLRLEIDDFFVIEGRLLDDAGQPLADMPLKGVHDADPERGDEDPQRRYVTRTRQDGTFALWANSRVDRVQVRSSHFLLCEVEGPWRGSARVVLDCRTDGFVVVSGRVLDARGAPRERVAVHSVAADGALGAALGTSGVDGWFRVPVKRTAKAIVADLGGGLEARVDGPWLAERVVELRPAR